MGLAVPIEGDVCYRDPKIELPRVRSTFVGCAGARCKEQPGTKIPPSPKGEPLLANTANVNAEKGVLVAAYRQPVPFLAGDGDGLVRTSRQLRNFN